MYRRPKFLETLLEIRREMALEADYDVDLFVGRVRQSGSFVNSKTLTTIPSTTERDGEAETQPIRKRRRKVSKN